MLQFEQLFKYCSFGPHKYILFWCLFAKLKGFHSPGAAVSSCMDSLWSHALLPLRPNALPLKILAILRKILEMKRTQKVSTLYPQSNPPKVSSGYHAKEFPDSEWTALANMRLESILDANTL